MKQLNNLLVLGLAGVLTAGPAIVQAQGGPDAEIFLEGRSLNFSNNAEPFFRGRTALVPLREMASHLGAQVRRNERGNELRITYRGSEAIYYQWRSDFELNGRTRRLPAPGQEHRAVMFVPLELFRDLTNRDMDARQVNWANGDRPRPRPDWGEAGTVSVYYRGRELRFDRREQPRRFRGTVYLPLRATARQTDVNVERDRSGNNIRLRFRGNVVEYENGRENFDLNGRQIRMPNASEEVDDVLYVPQVMFEALVGRDFEIRGGGSWNNGRPSIPDWDNRPGPIGGRTVSLYLRDRELRFGGDEQPFAQGSDIYVPLRAFAKHVGVRVERDESGMHLRLNRDRDEVRYTQPYNYYELNGRRQPLRGGSVEIRGILFVPIDVFNVFTDGRVEVRRR